MVVVNKKHFTSGAQGAAEVWNESRLAEHSTAGRDADHIAITVNGRQVRGAFFGDCPGHPGGTCPPGEYGWGHRGARTRRITSVGKLGTRPCANQFEAL